MIPTATPTKTTNQPFPNFGPLLTYAESVKSATALRKGIANVPNSDQYKNMVRVYQDFYVPICKKFGKAPITSFFRSKALNTAVGGSKTSAHMAGCAIDIDFDGMLNATNKQLYDWCRANLKFDQLITEFPDANGKPAWIHIAHNRDGGKDRQQCMRAVKKNGQVYYIYE